jgi:fatty-acyl-CoA synthase
MTQLSIVRGASEPALLEYTIGEALLRAARQWPKQEALVSVHQGIRWTYEQFSFEVDRIAAGLLALGLKVGDRVGVWAPNCAEWTLVQFATARVGDQHPVHQRHHRLPKGATLTHRNILNNGFFIGEA